MRRRVVNAIEYGQLEFSWPDEKTSWLDLKKPKYANDYLFSLITVVCRAAIRGITFKKFTLFLLISEDPELGGLMHNMGEMQIEDSPRSDNTSDTLSEAMSSDRLSELGREITADQTSTLQRDQATDEDVDMGGS